MQKKVGCIGCGVMGGALMQAIRTLQNTEVHISDVNFAKAEQFASDFGVIAEKTNRDVLKNAEYIFLAVKPQYLNSVLDEIKAVLTKEEKCQKVFISIAAGVKIASIAERLSANFGTGTSNNEENTEKLQIIRVMPNIPAVVQEAMIALAPNEHVTRATINTVQDLLSSAGVVQVVSEHLIDGITAISGSGPAYGFMFIEALADAAVGFGLDRKQAITFASQTLKGAATMVLDTGKHPAVLKDEVCSPAGTTIEAVRMLEEKNFRSAIISAANAAFARSTQLGKK